MIPAVFVATHRAIADLEAALTDDALSRLDSVDVADYWRTVNNLCRKLDTIHGQVRKAVIVVRGEEKESFRS